MDKKIIKNSFKLLLITANLFSIPHTVTAFDKEKYDPELQRVLLLSMEDQINKKKIQINGMLIEQNKTLTEMNEKLNLENKNLTKTIEVQKYQNDLLTDKIQRLQAYSQKKFSTSNIAAMKIKSLEQEKTEKKELTSKNVTLIPENHTLQASQGFYMVYKKELIGAFLLLLGGNLYFLGKALVLSLKANSAKRNPKKAATPSKRDKKYKRSGKKRGMHRLR